jgi:hypothetical protein
MELKLTDYLAFYGAVLSTIALGWNIRRAYSKIRVLLIFAISSDSRHGINISIQNPSTQVVHITAVSFVYPYRIKKAGDFVDHLVKFKRWPIDSGWIHDALSNHSLDCGCPISIEPGRAHTIFVPHEVLESVFKNAVSRSLRVVVQDELWRNTYSPKFEYP